MNFRADLGEFHFLAGAPAAGERVLLELIRDHPDRAIGYARLADLFGRGSAPDGTSLDRERDRELLEQALAWPVTDAADYGDFRKRFYPSYGPNQDVPFGQEGVAHQSGLNLLHRLLGE